MPNEKDVGSNPGTPATPETPDQPVDFSDLNAPADDLDQLPETPKTKTQAQAAPAVSTHPQALVDAALAAGLSQRFIDKQDTESLYEALVVQSNKAVEFANQRQQRQYEDEPRRQAPEPEDPYEAELVRAQEDGMAPTLISAQRRMAKELKEIKAQNEQRLKLEQDRRQAEIFDAADEAMDSLAKSLDIELTKGQKRRLFMAAGVTPDDSPRMVKKKVTEAGLELPLAKKAKTPPVPANGVRKPTVDEYEGRLSRPTATFPSRAKGDRANAQALRDEMVRMGITKNAGDRDEYEGVPD